MLIRNQEGTALVDMTGKIVGVNDETNTIAVTDFDMRAQVLNVGTYDSAMRAKAVLKEIAECYRNYSEYGDRKYAVFEMPYE
ncbi:MAG: hypothetical protein LUG62_01210 [Clostridiales bacterium]|nr:hypothetical protein [Clostridiales bacterium]